VTGHLDTEFKALHDGGAGVGSLLRLRRRGHGRAVHVDPMKPTLKAPGTKRVETVL